MPHRAVVDRAEHQRSGRVRRRLHAVVASNRTSDRDRRLAGDPAGVRRRPHHLPRRVTAATLANVDDVDAVGVLRLRRLLGGPVGRAVGEQQDVVGVLAVLHQQPLARAATDREVDDPVVVHPPLLGLVGGAVAGVRRERRPVRHRITPGDQHPRRVARRDHHRVRRRRRDRREPERAGRAARAAILRCAGMASTSAPTPERTAAPATPPPISARRESLDATTSWMVSLPDSFEIEFSSTIDMRCSPLPKSAPAPVAGAPDAGRNGRPRADGNVNRR